MHRTRASSHPTSDAARLPPTGASRGRVWVALPHLRWLGRWGRWHGWLKVRKTKRFRKSKEMISVRSSSSIISIWCHVKAATILSLVYRVQTLTRRVLTLPYVGGQRHLVSGLCRPSRFCKSKIIVMPPGNRRKSLSYTLIWVFNPNQTSLNQSGAGRLTRFPLDTR